MKDQYFGDINDYRKYGLLRALQSNADGRLLVAWMLTPDDGGRDGGLRSYLEDPQTRRNYRSRAFRRPGWFAAVGTAAFRVAHRGLQTIAQVVLLLGGGSRRPT